MIAKRVTVKALVVEAMGKRVLLVTGSRLSKLEKPKPSVISTWSLFTTARFMPGIRLQDMTARMNVEISSVCPDVNLGGFCAVTQLICSNMPQDVVIAHIQVICIAPYSFIMCENEVHSLLLLVS